MTSADDNVHAVAQEAHLEEEVRRRQFVEDLSPDVKAEWIDGEAVYHSPTSEIHNRTTHGLNGILGVFSMFREALIVRVEKAMIELEFDNFEPDICVWRAADHRFDQGPTAVPAARPRRGGPVAADAQS